MAHILTPKWPHHRPNAGQVGETFEVQNFDSRVRFSRTRAEQANVGAPQQPQIAAASVAITMPPDVSVVATPMPVATATAMPLATTTVTMGTCGGESAPEFCPECGKETVPGDKFCGGCCHLINHNILS